MPGNLLWITVLLLVVTRCISQDPRPTFPDVFQTEMEGTFIEENEVVEIDASMFYDRTKNRVALFVTKGGELTKMVYNFDNDEAFTIDSNDCEVQPIPEEQGIFPFTVVNGRKILATPEKLFLFTEKSKLQSPILQNDIFPVNKYVAENFDAPQYGQSNCTLTHIFSKPDVELPSCKEGIYCNSILISVAVECMNEKGGITVNNNYRFFKFIYEIQDEAVFLPPPGVHCDIKSAKEAPRIPPYFSFAFDIFETQEDVKLPSVFNTHKEVWYDSEYNIIRIDEFDYNELLLSSRIFDLRAGVAFTIIATVPICEIGKIDSVIIFDQITRLPKFFFYNDSSVAKEVYVGKRKVHGLDYDVWSRQWSAKDSEAKVVEEAYFLEIIPNREMTPTKVVKEPYFLISHIDMYTYEMDEASNELNLVLLKYYAISNFRANPKEWAAFDASTCFKNNEMKEFSMKVKGPNLVKESQSYREALQRLYSKIISATGVSVVRISELRGVFEGVKLLEVKGLILDNSESVGWPKDSTEPGMEETFNLIKKAASENKLSVTFMGDDNQEITVEVVSVDDAKPPTPSVKSCFSGSSLAAASLVLLLIGISFGIAGYYVFLKKRSTANVHVRMSEINPENSENEISTIKY